MVCIHCNHDTKVINSRPQKRANHIWRRRQCLTCGSIFTSEELPKYELAWLVKTQAGLQPFSRDKLFLSLHRSLQHRTTAIRDATGIADTVVYKLSEQASAGVIESRTIIQTAHVALNRFDTVASMHYQAYHK